MAAPSEATVKTLTAEVRTLAVGSRQITLSVAKQLDIVPLSDLAVMGRVNLSGERPHVIGVGPDGTLSLARYEPRTYGQMPQIYEENIPSNITLCGRVTGGTLNSPFYRLSLHEDTFEVHQSAVEWCKLHPQSQYWTPGMERCDGWSGPVDAISGFIAGFKRGDAERIALNKAAAAAPLIVLAGLK